jgi:O-antigen/teichoic acid export membrane protein
MEEVTDNEYQSRVRGQMEFEDRNRIVRNVLASWGGHMLFIIAGFILPRYINDHIGQTPLGVWDFSWSIVNYFGLATLGIGSSVNRYVAKYRAENDAAALNRAMSSVMCVQMVVAVIIFLLTFVSAWLVPALFASRLNSFAADVRWVILFLGTSLAVEVAFDTYGGVMTGCHRWDLHNFINGFSYGTTVAGMIIALSVGGGLVSLSFVYLCGTICKELTRAWVAYRICPELRIRLKYAEWSEIKIMFNFGSKSFLIAISGRLLYQTNNIIVAAYFGAAALALYARPIALVLNLSAFLSKFAFIFTPIASQLEASGKEDELRKLFYKITQYSVCMAFPAILFLIIFGGQVLLVWMGKNYEQAELIAILAIGHLMTIGNRPVVNLLTGIGAHGRPAVANLLAAILSVIICLITVGILHWGLIGAALSVGLSLMAVDGMFLPLYACKRLNVPTLSFFRDSWLKPILLAIPLIICLLAIRALFSQKPVTAILLGLASGGIVIGITYWKWVVPAPERIKIKAFLSRFRLARIQASS